MTRKITFGLFAAAAIGAAAVLPTSASAHGFHGWGWGFGHHGFYGFGGPALVVDDGCLVREMVQTRRGPRIRLVNVCGY